MFYNDFGIMVVLYDLGWPLRSYFMLSKICVFLEKFLKDWALNKKYIVEKEDFEILRWHFVPFNDLWGHTSFQEKYVSLQY